MEIGIYIKDLKRFDVKSAITLSLVAWLICSIPVLADDSQKSILSSNSQLNNSIDQIQNKSLNYSSIEDASYLISLGNSMIEKGFCNRSIELFDLAIEIDPSFIVPYNNKGAALVYLGRYEDAKECFDKVIEKEPDSGIAWSNKGDVLFKMGDKREALICINKSIELDSANAATWNCKGVILVDSGGYESALNCFSKSIDLDLYFPEAWNNKGVALAMMGECEQALDCFKNAATINENYTQAWLNGGLVLKAIGHEKKAEEAFAQARINGYDKEITNYEMESEPVLMEESTKHIALPGLDIEIAVAILLIIGRKTRV